MAKDFFQREHPTEHRSPSGDVTDFVTTNYHHVTRLVTCHLSLWNPQTLWDAACDHGVRSWGGLRKRWEC